MSNDTTTQEFFEAKYRQNPDPWNFAASPYEQSRYRTTMEALGDHRYRRAFEPGCSVGVLTELLAFHCDGVEAMDISPTAVRQAQLRCRHLPQVSTRRGTVPEDLPDGSFDLIVLSEIGYYFNAGQWESVSAQLVERLQPAGTLLAVHWLGISADHLLSGDDVHAILHRSPRLAPTRSVRQPESVAGGFRLDCWSRI